MNIGFCQPGSVSITSLCVINHLIKFHGEIYFHLKPKRMNSRLFKVKKTIYEDRINRETWNSSHAFDSMTYRTAYLLNPKYRPDIDGLRAIAVLSVVVFHAFPKLMQGGFIGVDIFFVISGFLISTIIFEELDKGTFSFASFYSRRIRRIFPALVFVLLTVYIIGWFLLFDNEYKQLSSHIAASSVFFSNFLLWSESGYFDSSAEAKPLLHLWSLGIEEQFYILWPMILWLGWKRKFNPLKITAIFTVVSFLLNEKGIGRDSVATFYSPQTRFWELLSGSLLAWFSLYKKRYFGSNKSKFDLWLNKIPFFKNSADFHKKLTDTISLIGLLVLIYGFSRINKTVLFPGNWALIPVCGAMLIIIAGPSAWVNRLILSNRLAIWFGLISFPLYLWHWPLLSFAYIINIGSPSRGVRFGVVVISIILAWLTYWIIESPMRFGGKEKSKVTALIVLLASIALVGYCTFRQDGFRFRANDKEVFIYNFENSFPNWTYFQRANLMREWRYDCDFLNVEKYLKNGIMDSTPRLQISSSCYKRDAKFDKSVLIWGDSHAQALRPGISRFIPKNWQVLQIATSGCAPKLETEGSKFQSRCARSNLLAIETVKKELPDVVVIAQSNNHSFQTMSDLSKKLNAFGVKKIVFVGPTPQWNTDLPKIIARRLWKTKEQRTQLGINRDIISSNKQLSSKLSSLANTKYIDIINLLCNLEGCLTYTGDDIYESLTTWDYGHLTPSASKYLARQLLVDEITSN